MSDKFSLMPEDKDPLRDLRTDIKMQQAVTKKKQKKGSGDPYLDLQRDQFDFMKQEKAEAKEAAQQSAMTQGIVGGAQSAVQTSFGSQSQEQALGGALTTGLQMGLATGNPYIGAGVALGSLFLGSRSAKKAEAERKKAEQEETRLRKLQNMREALAGYGSARQKAMQNLMTV